jgi:phospholipid/cholesterol/gamma-HCH transport system substrate-binding protein
VRRIALIVGLAAAVVCGVLVVGCGGGGDDRYKFAVTFDTAKGVVPGQLVKVAGVRAGKVDAVDLAPGNKARMELEVDSKFGPFRSDARCRILPEGLISENYVECNTGSPAKPALPADRTGIPAVPVGQTTAPVSLQDVLNTFDLPTDQRLRMLLNNLGLGTAGRGGDINAILRRANPSLTQARRVLQTLSDQRREVANAVGQTDAVLAELGGNDGSVRQFVDRAAVVTETTAAHRGALEEAVKRLPATLDAARGGLRSLDAATAGGGPLLDDLKASAPALLRVTKALPDFAREGRPAVRSLVATSKVGRRALEPLLPVTKSFGQLATISGPFAKNLGATTVSLRDRGGWEGVLRTAYSLATSTAIYDDTSHYFSLFTDISPQCFVPQHITPVPGCSHAYNAPGKGQIPINDPAYTGAQAKALVEALGPGAPDDPALKSPLLAPLRKMIFPKGQSRGRRTDVKSAERVLDFLLK